MILSKKIRLIPNKIQEKQLWKSVNTARFIYNWTLNRQQENYKQGMRFIQDGVLRKEITQLKKSELSWLNGVSNNIAKQAVKDACNAYQRFFKGLSRLPRFKSKKKANPSFYNDNIKLKSKENSVLISKVGWIKTNEQLPIGVKYSNPRISFDGKYWYLSVGLEKEIPETELTDVSLGVDLGIKDLAICSNRKIYKNINKSKKVKLLKKKLKRLQKQVSRKYVKNKEGSSYIKTNNILKIENKIRLLYRRIHNIRNNYLHQVTTEIVKTKPSKIVMEDLNIKGMMKNKHLSKAIAEQSWYKFITYIKYKCMFYGIEFIQANRYFPSSKTCSHCGSIKKDLKLKDRTFRCECGFELDRDLNASINLANYIV